MENKRVVKINFAGFWRDLDPESNFFTNILKKKFEVEISDDPDYLFCSVFSHRFVKYENCIRIFFSGECQTPDFNLFDYGMGFDYLDFSDRYFRVPLYLLYGKKMMENAESRGGMREKPVYKDKFCSFVYSNQNADPIRGRFYRMLSEYRTVNSGGRFMNNVGGMVENKLNFEAEHRFSIAFENGSYPGYMSEKIFQAFAAGTIPIYWGDRFAGRTINKKAYIDVNSFKDIDDAIEYIKGIDSDQSEYIRMLSEPVFAEGYAVDKHLEKTEEFLFHIFDQGKDEAFRRNRTFRGRNYERFYARYGGFDDGLIRLKNALK